MTPRKAKLAVSLDAELVDRMRQAVAAGRARSVSALVEHAVRARFAAKVEFDQMLDEMLAATGGPPTPEENAAAARILGIDAA